ncbi:MAG TPA: response regulator, partial [Polyangia bacterium]
MGIARPIVPAAIPAWSEFPVDSSTAWLIWFIPFVAIAANPSYAVGKAILPILRSRRRPGGLARSREREQSRSPAFQRAMSHTLLLIQDNPSDAKVVQDALHGATIEQFRVEWVRSLSDGLARLVSDENQAQRGPTAIAAVLVDLMLPDGDGIETFDRLFRLAPQIPILVLTDPQDEDLAKLAVQHGAQDYLLTAHLDSYLLPKALRIIIERAAIAEALFDQQERAQVTLDSIGDAVISTDVRNCVTYLNAVAEGLTGWSRGEAEGRPIDE